MSASPGNIIYHGHVYLADRFYLSPCRMNSDYEWVECRPIISVEVGDAQSLANAIERAAEVSRFGELPGVWDPNTKQSRALYASHLLLPNPKPDVSERTRWAPSIRDAAKARWEIEAWESGAVTLTDKSRREKVMPTIATA